MKTAREQCTLLSGVSRSRSDCSITAGRTDLEIAACRSFNATDFDYNPIGSRRDGLAQTVAWRCERYPW